MGRVKLGRGCADPSYRDNYATEITTNKTDVRITKITVRSIRDLDLEITPPAIEGEVDLEQG